VALLQGSEAVAEAAKAAGQTEGSREGRYSDSAVVTERAASLARIGMLQRESGAGVRATENAEACVETVEWGSRPSGEREMRRSQISSKAMIQMSGLWEGGCWCWYRTRCPVGRRHMGANVWFFRAPCLRELYAWTSRSFVFSSIPTTFPKKRFYVSGTSQMIISP